MSKDRFARFAWGVLFYNIAVILWGAYVRASVSGDGCGAHWPLCNGEIIPTIHKFKTAVEFAHRISTGIVIPLVITMLIWAYRAYPKTHPVRRGVQLSLFFTFTEALVGAGLVLFKLVAHNATIYRAGSMSVHLVNTFLLLASLTLTAWWASEKPALRLRGQGAVGYAILIAVFATLVLAVSGAVTALGDTLYLNSGLSEEHPLVRLRVLHPLIAASVGLYLLLIAGLLSHLRPSEDVRRCARWVASLFLIELAVGAVNVLLRAPIPMQIIHLFTGDLTWITIVLLSASSLAEGVPHVEVGALQGQHSQTSPHVALEPATWKDYLALTKPRVISLLLFTTLAAMFIARDPQHPVSLLLFVCVALGGYMAAGAANAINMVVDRDIDGLMARTTQRPTVTQKISSPHALTFAFALEAASFALLWGAANLLSAMLAFAGLVFYVIVYTLFLKRRTWHNIVIGGAAGAFPPLVGWAAVTGDLSPLAWCLFAIIFVWTPVHFWALAILLKDDYAAAGIPMLPVVRSERMTVVQIVLYTLLTAIVSILPMLQNHAGRIYFVSILLLNALLLLRSLQLYWKPSRPRASRLFHYSMAYLALLFLMLAIDRVIGL